MASDVRSAARSLIVSYGIEKLTLKAIAQRVGVTPAALYHHFERGLPDIILHVANDIVDDLAAALHQASSRYPRTNYAMRMIAPSRVLRSWAIEHQREFFVLFGSPVQAAGDAHLSMTSSWVRRLAGVWGPVFADLWTDRGYTVPPPEQISPRLRQQMLAYVKDTGVELPPEAAVAMLCCWRSLYGQIAIEVFGHFAFLPEQQDQQPMFELLMQELISSLGLQHLYEPPNP
ncbi:TetR family transcriptional regulator [Streptomyces althioticus]|uniref:TetR/AcrR family transcriptional regulator n=1 Tax=Streptomyces althioticus TaxID=83380 RepID=UPI0019ADE2F6|nr:TetR family transcriptional regulator [Streptomyces althioticus]